MPTTAVMPTPPPAALALNALDTGAGDPTASRLLHALQGTPLAITRRPLRFHRCDPHAPGAPINHDGLTKASVAEALAGLLGYRYAGVLDSDALAHGDGATVGGYVVPSDTLTSLADAHRLGIHGVRDLFGGVVPHPFVATKLITHALWRSGADAPAGWSYGLGEALGDAVLPGFSVFTADDAWHAGNALLAIGPVRLKDAGCAGGAGQSVAHDKRELASQIEDIGDGLLAGGFVVECNLVDDVTVHSVGQVQVGDWLASYVGDQHNTRNHRGHEVYGGSNLLVARGGYDDLLRLDLSDAQRHAVAQALRYQEATHAAYPTMFASRNNYDIAQGVDGHGQRRSGVLEQSWRIGGCSGAEVAALHAFKADDLHVVRASTHEVYADVTPPDDAIVHYDGTDPEVGRLVKYVQLHRS